MAGILFLAHRIPFPPDRGDKIRSHHLLRGLSELAPVHVGCFAENDDDWAQETALADIAESHCVISRVKPLWRAGIEALVRGKPVSLTAFESAKLTDWISSTIKRHEIDTIFVFSGQMGQFIPPSFSGRVVVDLCDVDSAKFEAYGEQGKGPRAWIDRREGLILAAEEARLSRRADDILLISEPEADLFRSRLAKDDEPRISVLRNGIDHAAFDPAVCEAQTELEALTGPKLVFTGQMDYPPNIVAAQRAIRNIMPMVRAEFADASLHIVGRAAGPELLAFDGQDGIRVWGEVPDVRPFLRSADIVLAPLAIARGVQNKVLEAMAMARPVVLSAEAATGIHAQDGAHFAIGVTDAALAEAICALWRAPDQRQQMGKAAREFVIAEQSWPAMLSPLAGLVGRAGRAGLAPPRPDAALIATAQTVSGSDSRQAAQREQRRNAA